MQKENLNSTNVPDSGLITVFYSDGGKLSISGRPFGAAVSLIWSDKISPISSEPLKIIHSGKLLYADKDKFQSYLRNELDLESLIRDTECDQLCRNRYEVFSENVSIEIGSLWKLKGKSLFLVDDDNEVLSDFDVSVFEVI